MNQEQVLSLVRSILSILGTFTIAYGYTTGAQWEAIVGGIVTLTPVIWAMWSHTHASAIATVGKLAQDPKSPVLAVLVAPTDDGRELVQKISNPLVVSAGTTMAKTVAQ